MNQTPRDPWAPLGALTSARIALGRAGGSLPTRAHLAYQLAQARARDAVHHVADLAAVARRLEAAGLTPIRVGSAASDRPTYLRRPDLGRRLSPADRERLAGLAPTRDGDGAIVIADGLSGLAAERHAAPLTELLAARLSALGWVLAPPVLVAGGRVAIGDEIGALLRARLVAVLIGERPGLSAADSLGAYLTWAPRIGRLDAERNCVSNIRPEGLPIPLALEKLLWLMAEARRRAVTGVSLKEEMGERLVRETTGG